MPAAQLALAGPQAPRDLPRSPAPVPRLCAPGLSSRAGRRLAPAASGRSRTCRGRRPRERGVPGLRGRPARRMEVGVTRSQRGLTTNFGRKVTGAVGGELVELFVRGRHVLSHLQRCGLWRGREEGSGQSTRSVTAAPDSVRAWSVCGGGFFPFIAS